MKYLKDNKILSLFKTTLFKNGKKESAEICIKILSKNLNKSYYKSSKNLFESYLQNQVNFFSVKVVKRSRTSLREIPFFVVFLKRLRAVFKALLSINKISSLKLSESIKKSIVMNLKVSAKQKLPHITFYTKVLAKKTFSHFRWWV